MTDHTHHVRYTSRTYTVLCYARTRRDWFSAEDYRKFQLYKEEQTQDIGKSFKTLVRNGYLEQTGDLSRAMYKITAYGIEALAHIGVHRIKQDSENIAARVRENRKERQQA